MLESRNISNKFWVRELELSSSREHDHEHGTKNLRRQLQGKREEGIWGRELSQSNNRNHNHKRKNKNARRELQNHHEDEMWKRKLNQSNNRNHNHKRKIKIYVDNFKVNTKMIFGKVNLAKVIAEICVEV